MKILNLFRRSLPVPGIEISDSKAPIFAYKSIFLIIFVTTCCILIFSQVSFLYAEDISYTPGEHRDPFIPLVGPDGLIMNKIQASNLIVEGIIYDPRKGSLALISGDLYKAGDEVKGAVLKEILKDRVILTEDDEDKTIWLREELANRI